MFIGHLWFYICKLSIHSHYQYPYFFVCFYIGIPYTLYILIPCSSHVLSIFFPRLSLTHLYDDFCDFCSTKNFNIYEVKSCHLFL